MNTNKNIKDNRGREENVREQNYICLKELGFALMALWRMPRKDKEKKVEKPVTQRDQKTPPLSNIPPFFRFAFFVKTHLSLPFRKHLMLH